MSPLGSIFGRILALHLAALAVVSAAIIAAGYFLFDAQFMRLEGRALALRERAIAEHLAYGPSGWTLPPPMGLPPGLTYAVSDLDGRVLVAPETRTLAFGRPSPQPRLVKDPAATRTFVVASFRETRAGRPVWIQVAEDLSAPEQVNDDLVASMERSLLWVVAALLAALAVADAMIVRRALRPALEASSMAAAIEPSRIDLRLPADRFPVEIRPLAATVNSALDRLERGFQVQREFTADAAHELRTPLTVLRLRVEALCAAPTAAALKADIDVMTRIVDQLLSIAEVERARPAPDQACDLCEVAERAAGYLGPLAIARGKEVAFAAPGGPVWVVGDAELLFQAARNLIENALTHTAAGTTVDVEVGPQGAMQVLDRGPGVPKEHRADVFRRFWRRRTAPGGAGLGLAIVAKIAETHGGSVSVTDREGGGAVFVLRLRRVPGPPVVSDAPPGDRPAEAAGTDPSSRTLTTATGPIEAG